MSCCTEVVFALIYPQFVVYIANSTHNFFLRLVLLIIVCDLSDGGNGWFNGVFWDEMKFFDEGFDDENGFISGINGFWMVF